jgi:hypothetical protein
MPACTSDLVPSRSGLEPETPDSLPRTKLTSGRTDNERQSIFTDGSAFSHLKPISTQQTSEKKDELSFGKLPNIKEVAWEDSGELAKKIYSFNNMAEWSTMEIRQKLKVKGSYNDYVRNRERIEQNKSLVKAIMNIQNRKP